MDYHCGMKALPLVFAGLTVLAGFAPGAARQAPTAAPVPTTAAPPAAAAIGSPEWIVDRFFAQKAFPEIARYSTGEFAELYKDSPTLGSTLPPSVTVSTRALARDASSAVFGVSITDGNLTKEWYAYLREEAGTFKLEAIRTLVLGGRFIDALLLAEKAAVDGKLSEAGLQELERFHRIIASDAELKTDFLAQQPLFEALAKDFSAIPGLEAVSLDGDVSPAGSATTDQVLGLAQQLRALRLGAIIAKFRDCEGCTVLKIGGDGENQVGYLHAGPEGRVPKMTPQSFIYIEPIGSGWYLFKTV